MQKTVQIMLAGRGTHFEPDMLDAFIEIQEELRNIAQCLTDSDADMQRNKDYLIQASDL